MSTWNDEYYEIIDFYFWEPQHIGRRKNEKSKYKNTADVKKHILKMEVSLNHQINLFFRLVPSDFISKLVKNYFNKPVSDNYIFHGQNEWEKYIPAEETQPDLILSGKKSNIAIELKISAKSNMEQLAKYLLLHQLNKMNSEEEKKLYLLYISPFSFDSLWVEKFKSKNELVTQFKSSEFSKLKEKTKKNINSSTWNNALSLIDNVEIEVVTYNHLYEFLIQYRNSLDMTQKYSDIANSLFLGIINELELRDVTKIKNQYITIPCD